MRSAFVIFCHFMSLLCVLGSGVTVCISSKKREALWIVNTGCNQYVDVFYVQGCAKLCN